MFLKSDLGQFMLSRITSGTTLPLINFADTRRFKVPMLSESEADDIVKALMARQARTPAMKPLSADDALIRALMSARSSSLPAPQSR